ncbi:asparagine synthase (glutamine-hydrolyzing) [Pullulanibacillus pueri]|uniref:asparagine synthase (glutamine-hydrolyzing) n=1 Tax=Pullulanibacillus pueri TaxID=1437324 RepID=A0A8J2ZWV9_9BACL|nr:asparagine synthase (glutamine-hydrolyzing) [Pullulanibacillus pueri]MBM7681764.1 asparagine synthase (glutamine-hydrolyzing) [Pullulanibacillus pueri]GGH84173.1 asparagine synthetase [glutamine-hydrolyzing] 3 [Pullulanibacillus pueri]
MCGITGWIDWNRDLRGEEATVRAMAQTLNKRGPDDLNTYTSPYAALGHARLTVVDPEGGKQPMTRTLGDRHYTLVYNGELYNTEEIRSELYKKGHRFRGHSDTEVLLTSYMEWGPDCLERFNGIFAFVIWDEKKQQAFAARDRLGVKPFFYTEKNGHFIFGSEHKAILAHPDIEPIVDREGLAEVFGLGPSKTPGHGVYKDIDELRSGHALLFSREGLKVWKYWDVKSAPHEDNEEQTIEKLRELFNDAVVRQLVADVPVATFLSGGLDSSAITAVAAQEYKKRNMELHTYSIDYEGNDQYFESSTFTPDPDGPWVEKVTKALGTKHHSLVIDQQSLVKYLTDSVHARDLPGYSDIDSSMLWFCEGIKEGATVALSGECADEIFGGYPWFHSPETSAKEGFPWMRSTEARQNLLSEEWRHKLQLREYTLSRFQETINETPKLEGESEIDAKRRQLFYLNMHWFMAALLERKDRMSMAASLEVRVPFADHRIVEYLWNVPWDMKMMDGREKGLFRRALKGVLPEDVLYRKKSPYPKTFHPAYTKAVVTEFTNILNDRTSPIQELLDKKQLQTILETEGKSFDVPWYGQLMQGPQLIAHLIEINTWLKDYNVKIIDQ